jgi:uncharacterized protein
MLTAYRTPGVYFEWLDKPPALVGVRTDIAGFVGIAERGPLFTPVKIESWTQFASVFGGYIPQGYLAYAVDGFFANGGMTCWVVRIADDEAVALAALSLVSSDRDEVKAVHLRARTPGSWGEDLAAVVSRSLNGRFTLTLRLTDGTQEVWPDATITEPGDPRYLPTLLNDNLTGSQLVEADVQEEAAARQLRLLDLELVTSRFAYLALPPDDNNDDPDGLKQLQPKQFQRGLAALEVIDDVSLVAIPDIMPKPVVPVHYKPVPLRCHIWEDRPLPPPPERKVIFPREFDRDEIEAVQQAIIRHCHKLKNRIAILDSHILDLEPTAVLNWRRQFDSKYAALYYPWLLVPDPLRLDGLVRPLPPSGHVAGIFARVDRQVGVHKAPANEPFSAVQATRLPLTDLDHGRLNEAGVNVIRTYPGRGVRIAGARTLSSDSEWRFLNVRRLFIMIGETLAEQLQWTVFEPNSRKLWDDIARVVRSFLDMLWQRGQLDGATPEDAFYVVCDETTNPPHEIDQGRVICEIGLQPPWPAEFVNVRIGKTEGGLEILE